MSKRDGRQSRTFRHFAYQFWPYCQWCDKYLTKKEATTEHIVPLGRSGTNRIWNLALACQPCNNNHGHKLVDRPLLGPRWEWPHHKHRTCMFLLPLTRSPVVSLYKRRRPLTSDNCLHLAFPIQLPITVELPPMSKGWPTGKARYVPGDMLVLADTMPNGDPLIHFEKKAEFEEDYRAVPYEGAAVAAHGRVTKVRMTVEVEHEDGHVRKLSPLDISNPAGYPWAELRRRVMDAIPPLAVGVSGLDSPNARTYDSHSPELGA